MRLHRMIVLGVATVAATCVSVQAGAGTRSALRVSGTYAVDMKAQKKVRGSCSPISKTNPSVLRCWSTGFTLIWSGSLTGRSVISYRGMVNCATGLSYTDGTEKFTGSVAGVGSGSSTWRVQYHGTFDCKHGEITSTSAYDDVYSGTGRLAGLYGTIHRGPGVYSGVLRS
jgi:hypothetical protein